MHDVFSPGRTWGILFLLGACWTGHAAPAGPATTNFLQSDACQLALVPHRGEGRTDDQIRRSQDRITSLPRPAPEVERLGWLFVEKARLSSDPGFYKLAEQCASCLAAHEPKSTEALLLRGHVLHSLHRFKEAESLARELTTRRGLSFDYGLLGDVLMEQGRLADAMVPYQKMLDLRPDLQGYARAAHMRWLKGDLEGALEMMDLATKASGRHAPEAAAWVHARAALYLWQAGRTDAALRHCETALEFATDYAPALLAQGRILLGAGRTVAAVAPLEKAAQLSPLPEPQWTLAEALRATGRSNDAVAVEASLHRRGAVADGRTYALFLATRGERLPQALRLTGEELKLRSDVFTHDARAWALHAAGQPAEAAGVMERALAEGTQDARLFLHAGVIAAQRGRLDESRKHLAGAMKLSHMLLPSERAVLERERAALDRLSRPTARKD